MQIALEFALIGALIFLNGFLALSELAIVSARKPRLNAMVRKGSRGAAVALRLAEESGRFLSSVQIGITLIGILAGVFSGATLADRFSTYIEARFAVTEAIADSVAYTIVVGVVTYLSLIIGELVPKQLALRNAERMAVLVSRPMLLLAKASAPLVALLDVSARLCLKLIGGGGAGEPSVTEDEIRHMMAEAETAGVVEPEERAMISAVMRLGDRPIRAVMTPRIDVDWVDLSAPVAEQLAAIRKSMHTRMPVAHAGIDHAEGIILVKDVLDRVIDGGTPEIAPLVRAAPAVPESADALDVLEHLRRSPAGMAFVVDEFGSLLGVVTSNDLLESIVGGMASPEGTGTPDAVRRDDGSWLIDGRMARDAAGDLLGIHLPAEEDYDTLAGFMLARFGHLPETGNSFEWGGWRFEVADMDGRRIDRVLISPLAAGEADRQAAA